ncbi:MAG: chemotaxis protein CheB [Planctomycetota bacterium]
MSESLATSETPTLVVGIGASAGGLEAIERLVEHMPLDTGMALVLVQHLSPDFKSLMDEVLSRWTDLPIRRVENGMPVEPNTIYLMPRRSEMVISGGKLLLTEKDPNVALTLPIDHFFRSLAQDCGSRSVAVVLSGTGSDGSRGVAEVHEAGGLVIAQDPETAKFDGMPRSALASGAVDLKIAPEETPAALIRFARSRRKQEVAAAFENAAGEAAIDESGLKRVFGLIRTAYGLDLDHYKPSTVVRRIERRLLLVGIDQIDRYAERLATDREELDQLYRDLLIGVTRFFRDAEAFENLRVNALPSILASKGEDDDLRVWVAGCATGEEAYSITMLIDEALADIDRKPRLKVFATDVHQESLDFAGQGVYPVESLAGVSQERLAAYFTPTAGGYQVSPRLRQSIVFAPHNLVKDAPFTKIDLIACRNLLIYLQPQSQKKVVSLFHFGLKTGGVLLMGPSESPGDVSEEFEAIDPHWKIYRKRRDIRLPADMRLQMGGESALLRPTAALNSAPLAGAGADRMVISTYDALLDLVVPNGLLIAESGGLVHTFGDAGRFLLPERGRFSGAAVDRLTPDLRVPVTTAMNKALKDQKPTSYAGVPARIASGETLSVDIRAVPVNDKRMRTRSVLVELRMAADQEVDTPTPDSLLDAGKISTEKISVLETELRYTKENLQATIEELETSNEELQATNEELVASNEELQSTNEELHSVNEELYTVNAEHQNQIHQLSELTRDMDNLLASTEVHTIFLDSSLNIRKFTPGGADEFNFLPQDVGRRIDSFTHRIECHDLNGKIERVIQTGEPFEEEVRSRSGNWFLLRILAYRAAAAIDGGSRPIDGALITLVDVTKLKEASDAVAESLRQRDRFLAMLSHELRNPLSTILNATHLVAGGGEGQDYEDDPVAVIRRQSQHMSTLLDDLLDVTRVSQGKISLRKRPFDLMQAARGALESVQARCDAREQQLLTDLPEHPVWVRGSEPRLLQVFSNLLTNASKYSGHSGRIELTIDLEPASQADGSRPVEDGSPAHKDALPEAVIRVRDNGVGISPEQLDKVFDMFVQANRTLARADGGLGVGLTLVKSLVELHGGAVTAYSDGEGSGSEFVVRLPTGPAPRESSLPKQEEAVKEAGRRVVLVEDNIDASRMLAFLLEEAGFQVSIAHDGRRGLELISATQPDAAVVDIGLPGMSGYEVARQIRETDELAGIRLIALTGYGQASDRSEALEAGFDEHVVKPVDPELLGRLLLYSKAADEQT